MKKLLIAMLGAALFCGCQGDYYHSNRCVTRDTNHTFTRAKILHGGGKVEEVEVVAWQDYQNSDSIQIWVKQEGGKKPRVIYTHLNNVILENPDPEFLPKFNKVF